MSSSHWLIKEKKIKEAHNPEVAGSNPAPATEENPSFGGFFVSRHLGLAIRTFIPVEDSLYLIWYH